MRKNYWLGIISLLALAGCEEIIPLELPEQASKLVVNSVLNPDSLARVYVYQSQALLAPRGISVISNAAVILSEDGQTIDTISFEAKSNTYHSRHFYPKPGHSYQLSVSAPGFEAVSASCQVPFPVPILHAQVKDSAGIDEYGDYYSQLTVQFADPEGTKNFYGLTGTVPRVYRRWKSYQPGQATQYDTLYTQSDVYLYSTVSQVEDTYDNGVVFKDELFEGKMYDIAVNFYPVQKWNTNLPDSRPWQLTVLFKHMDAFYYEYSWKLSKHLNNRSGGLFAGEPVSVPGNIANGYGVFSAYSQRKVEISLEE